MKIPSSCLLCTLSGSELLRELACSDAIYLCKEHAKSWQASAPTHPHPDNQEAILNWAKIVQGRLDEVLTSIADDG